MKRFAFLSGLAVIGLTASVTASAATMPLNTARLGNGSAAVSRCDPDGFTASAFTTSGGKVTSITVGGIDAACAGGQLTVNLTQGDTSLVAGGPVTVSGTSQLVTLTAGPDAWNVNGLYAIVVGP